MNVSLILATYGRAQELERAIESLRDQTQGDFELIIVDQNLDERVSPYVKLAADRGLDVRHVRTPMPGLSAARNIGISLAKHEILAFPDDDCWYEREVLQKIRQAFEGDPSLSGVIGQWVEASGRQQSNSPFFLDYAAFRQFRSVQVSSIMIFMSRAHLEALGGFDERLGVGRWYGAGEDTDIVLRSLACGARVRTEPSVRVHHSLGPSDCGSGNAEYKKVLHRGRGTGAIYSKHGLSPTVVVRGFLAPLLRSLISFSLSRVATGLLITLGRVEGYLRWKYRES